MLEQMVSSHVINCTEDSSQRDIYAFTLRGIEMEKRALPAAGAKLDAPVSFMARVCDCLEMQDVLIDLT